MQLEIKGGFNAPIKHSLKVSAGNDFTGQIMLEGLNPETLCQYRVSFVAGF